ncbi:MAG: serine kinase [Armatimonadota bacterium]
MTLQEIADKLNLEAIHSVSDDLNITEGYASDLLSDVLSKGKENMLWVTNQKHQNIIGVAVMLNLAGIIIVGGAKPDDITIKKAVEENVPLYVSDLSMFEVVGKLYEMGLKSV